MTELYQVPTPDNGPASPTGQWSGPEVTDTEVRYVFALDGRPAGWAAERYGMFFLAAILHNNEQDDDSDVEFLSYDASDGRKRESAGWRTRPPSNPCFSSIDDARMYVERTVEFRYYQAIADQ